MALQRSGRYYVTMTMRGYFLKKITVMSLSFPEEKIEGKDRAWTPC